MTNFKKLVSYLGFASLGLVMSLAACASSTGGGGEEKTENKAEALTCPPGYHLGCDGTRTPTGQCLGHTACLDADGNVKPIGPSPSCGHFSQACCMNPVSGPYCVDGACEDSICGCGHAGEGCCVSPAGVSYCFNGACSGSLCSLADPRPDGSTL